MSEQIDWEKVKTDLRERAAIAAMQGMLTCGGWDATRVAEIAVDYADKLIAELKKEVQP